MNVLKLWNREIALSASSISQLLGEDKDFRVGQLGVLWAWVAAALTNAQFSLIGTIRVSSPALLRYGHSMPLSRGGKVILHSCPKEPAPDCLWQWEVSGLSVLSHAQTSSQQSSSRASSPLLKSLG